MMDKLIAPTKEDLKAIARREYREKQEAERKKRIFDPRIRLIGIDKTALDQHVHEKQQKNILEQNLEKSYACELEYQNSILNRQLIELNDKRNRIQCEINEYQIRYQRKDQTRDFDLNDPQYKQKTPQFQGFDWLGEDLSYMQRKHMQQAQLRSCWKQQMFERNQIKADVAEAERTMEAIAIQHDGRLKEIDQTEALLRRQIQCNTSKFNLELSLKQKEKKMREQKENEEDNLAEIINNLTSDMLLERKDNGISSSLFGGNRKSACMYRGMTDDELKEIRQEQFRQIAMKKSLLAEAKETDIRHDETQKSLCNLFEIKQLELQRQRQQSISNQNATNTRLSQIQKQRNNYLNQNVYIFKPTDEYFQQFNTTTR